MSVTCAAPTIPMARHRRVGAVAAGSTKTGSTKTQLRRAVDVTATLGSLVTLSALVVLAGAVGGLVDGTPTGHDTTVTVTFDRSGH